MAKKRRSKTNNTKNEKKSHSSNNHGTKKVPSYKNNNVIKQKKKQYQQHLLCLTMSVCINIFLYYFIIHFSSTQCFTRIVPATPNHGLTKIPVVKMISDAKLKEHVRKGIPIVVTNQMNSWPAMKRWVDLNYFKEACPYYQFDNVSFVDYINYVVEIENYIKKHLTPQEAMNFEVEDSFYFSHNEKLFLECPKLWNDVKKFALVRNRVSKPTSFIGFIARYIVSIFETQDLPSSVIWDDWIQAVTWIGPPGSKTGLHYDDDPISILYQFKGEKKIRIWSPDQSKNLYPETYCTENSEYGTRFSKIEDIDNKKVIRRFFPKFQNATALEYVLKPGEMIYIPSGWWHHVEVLSTSVSVAARGYTVCEGLSFMPNFVINYLHLNGVIDGEGFCITPSYLKARV